MLVWLIISDARTLTICQAFRVAHFALRDDRTLSLSLLMFRITADYHDTPAALDHTAFFADRFDRRSNFHGSSPCYSLYLYTQRI